MGKPKRLTGTGAIKVLNAQASTGSGAIVDLGAAFARFGLQVVAASTNAQVLLQGALNPSSTASFSTLITFNRSSQNSGDTLWVTGRPVTRVRATLNAGASSNGATAWMCAAD